MIYNFSFRQTLFVRKISFLLVLFQRPYCDTNFFPLSSHYFFRKLAKGLEPVWLLFWRKIECFVRNPFVLHLLKISTFETKLLSSDHCFQCPFESIVNPLNAIFSLSPLRAIKVIFEIGVLLKNIENTALIKRIRTLSITFEISRMPVILNQL